MNQQSEEENYKSLKLYDFSNIKAATFYQLLSSQDLTLLVMKKSQLPLEILPDQKLELNEVLSNQLLQIKDQFFKDSDNEDVKNWISELSYENYLDREMLIIDACSLIIDFENKHGVKIAEYEDALRNLGIEGDFKRISSLIKQKRMRYKAYKKNKEDELKLKGNIEVKNDFYFLKNAASTRLGYHIPSDILLIDWSGTLRTLKIQANERGNKKD